MESRTAQRARLATASFASTGSPSCHFNPGRSRNVHVSPSAETSSASTIWRCGVSWSSTPYSVSHTSADALRTTYWVVQMGSKLASFACGTKPTVRPGRCASAGAARRAEAASAPAPAAALSTVLRLTIFIEPISLLPLGGLGERHRAKVLGRTPVAGCTKWRGGYHLASRGAEQVP